MSSAELGNAAAVGGCDGLDGHNAEETTRGQKMEGAIPGNSDPLTLAS